MEVDREEIVDPAEIIVIEDFEEEVERMAENGVHSSNTQRAMDFDWKGFKAWCRKARTRDENGELKRISPLPCNVKAVNS